MEIIEINDNLLAALHLKAAEAERKRMNYDLRTTSEDTVEVYEPSTIFEAKDGAYMSLCELKN